MLVKFFDAFQASLEKWRDRFGQHGVAYGQLVMGKFNVFGTQTRRAGA
jgi:hypothetical protein